MCDREIRHVSGGCPAAVAGRAGPGRARLRVALVAVAGCAIASAGQAGEATAPVSSAPQAAPFAVKKTATNGAIVLHEGEPIAEYFVDRANKPFLWRIIGPTGRAMTRGFPMADVPGETTDHVHQRGLAFAHEGVAGFDTWTEEATYRDDRNFAARVERLGAIRHRGYRALTGGTSAVIHVRNDLVDARNTPLLAEERRMTFSVAPGVRIIDVDIDLVAAYGPVELADMKDAGVLIRVPDSMAVDRKLGGTIVNSAGQRDADAWSKHAAWVDYHGPVEGEHLGIAILNHPSSFRHPTAWHVRTYGLFCANPFGMRQMNPEAESGAVSFAAGQRVGLRHRFVFHSGDERQAGIAAAYEAYAAETPPPLTPP